LANEVLISDDVESARQLSSEKTELKTAEFHSRRRHLQRLRANNADSHATSDIHLETLRALREFNGHMAAVAYPLLYKNGLLLDSRLVGGLES
jgi:phosphate:Na+ symporter